MKSFLGILAYIRNYYHFATLNILFNLVTTLFSLVSLAMIMPFLSLLFDTDITAATSIPPMPDFSFTAGYFIDLFDHHFTKIIVQQGKEQALMFICIMVVAVFFLKNLFRYLALFFMAPLRKGVIRDIRSNLFSKILSLPLSYFSDERKGDVLSRMTSDVQEIESGVISTLEATFKEPITIVFFLGAMIYMSPELTVFVLGMLVITAFIVGGIGKSLKRSMRKGQAKMGEVISIIDETLSGMRVIKAFTAEKQQYGRFSDDNNAYYRLMKRMQRKHDLSSPLSEFLGIGIVSIVLWFGGKLVLAEEGGMEAEAFITFMVIFSQLIQPAKSFSSAYYNIQKGLASVDRINKILGSSQKILEKDDAVPLSEFKKEIEYKNVSFAYYNFDDNRVLDSVNFILKKGKMIALVGQSGAGKSTLADLLPRFYDPTEGQVLIDGVDLKDYKLTDIRKSMGIVTQESILFNDTVFNNISFGVENASEEDVIRTAKIANAHDFITQMEHGYQTVIGDRGDKLSGGERQRLTIARAILNDPPILILDEATSSLDSQSEKLVQEAIYKLMENRTSIVIAHRLSTIKYADEIIVMQEGKIIERGNHISLLAKGGVYKKLVDMQAF